MNTNTNKLQRRIMRRVYFAFTVRILKHPVVLQLALFGLALMVFAQMVHVKRIIDTLLEMPVGSVPRYTFNAFMNGEMLTLIAIGAMVFVALSVPMHVWRTRLPKLHNRAIA